MAAFERIFGIPPGHTLREVRARHRAYDDDWNRRSTTREDNSSPGTKAGIICRPAESRNGWKKYGPDGHAIEEHEDLPL